MTSLQDGLEAKVGGSLFSLSSTREDVRTWNQAVVKGHVSGFDYRVLLGLGVDAQKPAHGDVKAYHERVGAQLERSERWIRLTVQVALEIRLALKEEVPLPGELRRVPWHLVPGAIENVREGRPCDDWPKSEKPKEGEKEIAKRVRQLVSALKKMEDHEEQGRALRHSVDALLKLAKKLGHGVPRCQLPGVEEAEPTTRTVAEVPDVTVVPDPVEGEPDEARGPGRRRPRGNGPRGGGRRGRPSGGVRGDNDQ